MLKEYTCIMCPRGCDISAQVENEAIILIEGASCEKGTDYVKQELIDPQRNIATSVLVEAGEFALVSVRLDKPIPKNMIFTVMEIIKKARVKAPIHVGQVLIKNVAGLDCNLIATKKVDRIN